MTPILVQKAVFRQSVCVQASPRYISSDHRVKQTGFGAGPLPSDPAAMVTPRCRECSMCHIVYLCPEQRLDGSVLLAGWRDRDRSRRRVPVALRPR